MPFVYWWFFSWQKAQLPETDRATRYVSRKSCCYVFISYILVMLAQFCAILLLYGHLSVQELLPWCCSSMSEINWNWNWNSRTPVVKCWTPNPQQTEIMDMKCWGQLACSELCVQWVSCIDGSTTVVSVIRYDTIRDASLTCARKPTWVGSTYRTEPTTKKCKKTQKN